MNNPAKILHLRNITPDSTRAEDQTQRHTIDVSQLLNLRLITQLIKNNMSNDTELKKQLPEFGFVETVIENNQKIVKMYLPVLIKKNETEKAKAGLLELFFDRTDPDHIECFHNYFREEKNVRTHNLFLTNKPFKGLFSSFFTVVQKDGESEANIENWISLMQPVYENTKEYESLSSNINEFGLIYNHNPNAETFRWVFYKPGLAKEILEQKTK